MPLSRAFMRNFLGHAPNWYKLAILIFLLVNPVLYWVAGPFVAGWALVLEFIFTLAMALKCYPLQSGGLLAIEAAIIGMVKPDTILHEVHSGFEVILLLMFMVAGIYFMKDLLLLIFTKLLLRIRSKILLALTFSAAAAVLSAFLDALTVIAVVMSVCLGFFSIYHKVASRAGYEEDIAPDDDDIDELSRNDLEQFRAFLRSLLMHAAIGTALGGSCTMVGEPQNLLIAAKLDWGFVDYFLRMAVVTVPVLLVGLVTAMALEKLKWFGYGAELPTTVRQILLDHDAEEDRKRTKQEKAALWVQAGVALWLVVGLAFHLAAVGIIGLSVIVLTTAFTGVIHEHALGKAFEESLPFTALLAVFFTVIGVINDQNLFGPVLSFVFAQSGTQQVVTYYLVNGALSAISDNVFVATVFIEEALEAFKSGALSREQFELLAVATNTGTNIPSVATPNGQAAFLFLLTSAVSPVVRLSYGRMMWMALPYTIVMSLTGLAMVYYWLTPFTRYYFGQ